MSRWVTRIRVGGVCFTFLLSQNENCTLLHILESGQGVPGLRRAVVVSPSSHTRGCGWYSHVPCMYPFIHLSLVNQDSYKLQIPTSILYSLKHSSNSSSKYRVYKYSYISHCVEKLEYGHVGSYLPQRCSVVELGYTTVNSLSLGVPGRY